MCDPCWVVLTQYQGAGCGRVDVAPCYRDPGQISPSIIGQLPPAACVGSPGHWTWDTCPGDTGQPGIMWRGDLRLGRDIVKLSPDAQHSLVMVMARGCDVTPLQIAQIFL